MLACLDGLTKTEEQFIYQKPQFIGFCVTDTSHKQQAAAVKLCELWGLGRDYHDEGGYYQHIEDDYQ